VLVVTTSRTSSEKAAPVAIRFIAIRRSFD
jgi:hypothetical protein